MYESQTKSQIIINRHMHSQPANIILKQNSLETFTPQIIAHLPTTKYSLTTTKYNNVVISNQLFTDEQLTTIFTQIQQWDIRNELFINIGLGTKLIQSMQGIKFPYLKSIHLAGCRIESVQMLCRIQMPSLMQLYLNRDNPIVEITSLRRCHFQNLDLIYLPSLVVRMDGINLMYAPGLGSILVDQHLRWNGSSLWVFKLQNPSTVFIQHTGLIKAKPKKVLKQKFYQLSTKNMLKEQPMSPNSRRQIPIPIPIHHIQQNYPQLNIFEQFDG